MLLLQYVLPLAVISFAYIRIWSKLRNHISPAGRNDSHRRRRKTTKMLVTMVCKSSFVNVPLVKKYHIVRVKIDFICGEKK